MPKQDDIGIEPPKPPMVNNPELEIKPLNSKVKTVKAGDTVNVLHWHGGHLEAKVEKVHDESLIDLTFTDPLTTRPQRIERSARDDAGKLSDSWRPVE